ncbi:MAG TPA: tetratricopeptide repeat protein [Kofleriaceae bacterium]|nr:tetratricopeptide repeat protein [Kofleriaceae bacterium]
MRLVAIIILLAAHVASAQPYDDLKYPPPEARKSDVKIDLPAIPAFELTPGVLTVKRLRVDGKRFLGQQVTVHGYVTFAYDCIADIRKPGETDRAAQARIDADPTLCERPKLYIGDTATTPRDQSLWVVDVPRLYNKLELTRIAKADRTAPDRCEPGEKDPAKLVCPPYREGDEVTVVGTFDLRSPHAETNSDGLLVYAAMRNATRSWTAPSATFEPTKVGAPPAAAGLPPLPPLARAVASPAPAPAARAHSLEYLHDGNKAVGQNHFDEARAAYKLAVEAWAGNHLAWYGLGMVELKTNHAAESIAALDHAVALAPDAPMYRLFAGVAEYELAVLAPAPGFDRALVHLRYAIAKEPHLWRAHFYLGRIARAQNRARDAASEFSAAIIDNPREVNPYIALAELYRRWDYLDQSLQVALQGTTNLPDPHVASNVFYEVGMVYDSKHQLAQAIEAYTHALDGDAGNRPALFQRGQAYFAIGDAAHAKADLEEFVKDGGQPEFSRQQARKMLMDLAAKRGSKH